MKFYIWSFEHKAWWKANSNGYTSDISHAGKFTLEVAADICNEANAIGFKTDGHIEEAMVPVIEGI